jgi:hypothetical protein
MSFYPIDRELEEAIRNKLITRSEAAVIKKVCEVSNSRKDGCYAGVRGLASMCGLNKCSVTSSIKTGKRLGYLFASGTRVYKGQRMEVLKTKWDACGSRTIMLTAYGISVHNVLSKDNTSPVTLKRHVGDLKTSKKGKAMKGFLPPESKPSKNSPTSEDAARARLLAQTIKKHRKAQAPISIPLWSKHFRDLREVLKVPDKTADAVLGWYCTRYAGKYIPRVFSAKGFLENYDRIYLAMEREVGPQVQITEEAIKICSYLMNRSWPKGSKSQLPQVMQTSLAEYKAFRNQILALASAMRADPLAHPELKNVRSLLLYFADRLKSLTPAYFLGEYWFDEVHQRVSNWESWSGNLEGFAFHRDAKQFQKFGRGIAESFCAKGDRWDALMEALHGSKN